MKKKLFLILLSIILLSAFSGCSQDKKSTEKASATEKLTIVTSFYPMYVFTNNIVHDIEDVELVNLTEPQQGCLHDYQLRPSDMKLLEKADIFVVNGAGMESFLEKVIAQFPDLKIVEASKGASLLEQAHPHEHEADEEHDADHKHDALYNPHVWVGVSGAISEVNSIRDQLIQFDPQHQEGYQNNAKIYIEKLEALKAEMHTALKAVKNKNIVTFHEAFPYFAKEFDLNIVTVIEREPGTEPSAGELAKTIELIRDAKVSALFAEPQYSKKAAETIARETNAKVYILDPVVTGSKNPPLDMYEKTMRQNLVILVEALIVNAK